MLKRYGCAWITLAFFAVSIASPSSNENDDRTEAKRDALLKLVGNERGLSLIEEIDPRHEPCGGHASMHVDLSCAR